MNASGTMPMACPRCGCHLVSRADPARAGRARSVLVCSRCSLPIEQSLDPEGRRRRLANVSTLLALVLAGGVLFIISSLHDVRSPGPEPAEAISGETGDGQ
jgi:DNA-directed RNA polymerase subunit RPC12/RpoP